MYFYESYLFLGKSFIKEMKNHLTKCGFVLGVLKHRLIINIYSWGVSWGHIKGPKHTRVAVWSWGSFNFNKRYKMQELKCSTEDSTNSWIIGSIGRETSFDSGMSLFMRGASFAYTTLSEIYYIPWTFPDTDTILFLLMYGSSHGRSSLVSVLKKHNLLNSLLRIIDAS